MGTANDPIMALLLLAALTMAASLLGDRRKNEAMCPSANGCRK